MSRWFSDLQSLDPRVLLGPGIGLDCAVIDFGDSCLVVKSDPITFTAEDIGWYAVQVNANDVATTGAHPRWFTATILLPELHTDEDFAEEIFNQIKEACESINVELVGGHTEITSGLDRTIIAGTMLGEVRVDALITPQGASPGDKILLTKGIPIEAGSILAREYANYLSDIDPGILERARNFLYDPGISVVAEARIAAETGGVTAMHDPTEGGLASGLWELADASRVGLAIDLENVPVLPEAELICNLLGVDPLSAIASGSLVLTVEGNRLRAVEDVISDAGIGVTVLGSVMEEYGVFLQSKGGLELLPRPERDSLAELFERAPPDSG